MQDVAVTFGKLCVCAHVCVCRCVYVQGGDLPIHMKNIGPLHSDSSKEAIKFIGDYVLLTKMTPLSSARGN